MEKIRIIHTKTLAVAMALQNILLALLLVAQSPRVDIDYEYFRPAVLIAVAVLFIAIAINSVVLLRYGGFSAEDDEGKNQSADF